MSPSRGTRPALSFCVRWLVFHEDAGDGFALGLDRDRGPRGARSACLAQRDDRQARIASLESFTAPSGGLPADFARASSSLA